MDKIMEFLPFLIPLAIVQFILLGYTLYHILTHKNYLQFPFVFPETKIQKPM